MSTRTPYLPPLLLWCDLQTSGPDAGHGGVLEAAFLVTDQDLVEVTEPIEFMVLPERAVLAGRTVIGRNERGGTDWMVDLDDPSDPTAVMHRTSGLADAWVGRFAAGTLSPAGGVAATVGAWLDLYDLDWRNPARPLVLAGAGVDRFHRPWLPHLGVDELVAGSSIDTSTVRRFLTHVARVHPATAARRPTHRASPDLRAALDEARAVRDLLVGALAPLVLTR